MIKRSLLLSLLAVAGSLHAQTTPADLDTVKPYIDNVCAACHNADGNSPLAANPKLAGQISEYLFKQMKDFKDWGEGQPPLRPEPTMTAMIASLDEPQMLALANYYASQTQQPEAAANAETVNEGQAIWRGGIPAKGVPACAACHGPAGAGMPSQYPRISGQFADYTLLQLQRFRDDGRSNDPSSMMRAVALKMTDKEMRAVADFAAGLR